MSVVATLPDHGATRIPGNGSLFIPVVVIFISLVASNARAQPSPIARPTAGPVVVGSAAISEAARETDIDQFSQSAAVDWRSFDIGSLISVKFAEPAASSATLNRVIAPTMSLIAGQLSATGQLYLINQAGVDLFRGSVVDAAGGFLASTVNISNSNFVSGDRGFVGTPPSGGIISNAGQITVGEAGPSDSALIANSVSNTGIINVLQGRMTVGGTPAAPGSFKNRGTIALGSASSLDVAGDFTQSGTLALELAGTGSGLFSQVSTELTTALDGGLDITLADSGSGQFNPAAGDSFDILTSAGITGDFFSLDLPALAGGLSWEHSLVAIGNGREAYQLEVVGASSVIEPPGWMTVAVGLASLGWMARRREQG